MTAVKFIHTADLHLDTPFKGLTRWNNTLAERLKDATFKSFRAIVDCCIKEKVDFLLISGDVFDRENSSLAAQLIFIQELQRLHHHGIPSFIVCGNHDPLESWLDTANLPETAHRFGSDRVETISVTKDESVIADIHGISFNNNTTEENLTKKFKMLKKPEVVSIALLHGTVGTRGSHENYAPFVLDDILKKGYDYWALGHIHKHHSVRQAHPAVVYPGNPQGRDFGETGLRGCYLVRIEAGHNPDLTFLPVQQIRFENLTISMAEINHINNLAQKIKNDCKDLEHQQTETNLIVRIFLTGHTILHRQLNNPGELDQLISLFNEGQLNREYFTWIDQIILNTYPDIDLDRIRKRNDFTAEVLNMAESLGTRPELLSTAIEQIEAECILPQIKREMSDLSVQEVEELLNSAKWLLLEQFIKEEQ